MFPGKRKSLGIKQNSNRRTSTGASSEAHSFKTRGGMPSCPYALLVPSERGVLFGCMKRDCREWDGIGMGSGGVGMLESSNVEMEEKREIKKSCFISRRDSGSIIGIKKSGEKVERQKLLETLLAKDQKDRLVEEDERLSHFFWINEYFISRTCLQ